MFGNKKELVELKESAAQLSQHVVEVANNLAQLTLIQSDIAHKVGYNFDRVSDKLIMLESRLDKIGTASDRKYDSLTEILGYSNNKPKLGLFILIDSLHKIVTDLDSKVNELPSHTLRQSSQVQDTIMQTLEALPSAFMDKVDYEQALLEQQNKVAMLVQELEAAHRRIEDYRLKDYIKSLAAQSTTTAPTTQAPAPAAQQPAQQEVILSGITEEFRNALHSFLQPSPVQELPKQGMEPPKPTGLEPTHPSGAQHYSQSVPTHEENVTRFFYQQPAASAVATNQPNAQDAAQRNDNASLPSSVDELGASDLYPGAVTHAGAIGLVGLESREENKPVVLPSQWYAANQLPDN